MFENTKAVKDLIVAEITDCGIRKRYAYGNTEHTLSESRQKIYERMQLLSRKLVKSTGMDITVIGEENLPSSGPVLYVATHKSVFDIVILVTLIKEPVIFIGKKEIKDMPFVHQWFDSMGCIYMDREDKKNALQSIIKGINELKQGQSIVLFPEGTRRMDNTIGHFKEGSFKLATKTQVPIVPIALSNTYQILEEKRRIQRTKVKVNIGKPIETALLSLEEQKSVAGYVQQEVNKLMQEILE